MRVAWYRWCIILSLAASWPCGAHADQHTAKHSPLIGKIWDVAAESFVAPGTLYKRLRQADFVLLGETHSNPQHHRLQALVIDRLVAQGRRPAVVFEMFEREHQSAIERARELNPADASRIARDTRMAERGWPSELYKPLIENVLAHDLPLIGADVSQASMDELVAHGLQAFGADQVEALGLDAPLPARDLAAMRAEIVAAHCGHAPAQLIDGMVAAQRARDASLADRLMANAGRDGAVLIAGSGHVRNDVAAPFYLRRRAPEMTLMTIAFTEIHDQAGRAAARDLRNDGASAVHDYLWFTGGREMQDPCERFKQHSRTLEQPPMA